MLTLPLYQSPLSICGPPARQSRTAEFILPCKSVGLFAAMGQVPGTSPPVSRFPPEFTLFGLTLCDSCGLNKFSPSISDRDILPCRNIGRPTIRGERDNRQESDYGVDPTCASENA
jgi:hypothetical protein